MFENFPYTDMHQLNLDWIIKIAKDFLDQYTHIQQLIADGEASLQQLTESGLTQLQEKADNLTELLQEWYNTHSADIADQLADALQDLEDWYTVHENYLDNTLAANELAFQTYAEQKAAETLETIPADYTTLSDAVNRLAREIWWSIIHTEGIGTYGSRTWNLFDNTDLTTGFLTDSGVIETAGNYANYVTTNFIRVNPSTDYTISSVRQNDSGQSSERKVVLAYNKYMAPIAASYVNQTGQKLSFVTGTSAYFVRISIPNYENGMFNQGDDFLPYREYIRKIDLMNTVVLNPEMISEIENRYGIFYSKSKNILDTENAVVGFLKNDGTIALEQTFNQYFTTDFCRIASSTEYIFDTFRRSDMGASGGRKVIMCYDQYFRPITASYNNVTGQSPHYTTPANAVYFRASAASNEYAQIRLATEGYGYVAYSKGAKFNELFGLNETMTAEVENIIDHGTGRFINKKILNLGDSIATDDVNARSYSYQFAQKTGAILSNDYAENGATLSITSDQGTRGSVLTQTQQAIAGYPNANYDIIMIDGGTNDDNQNRSLGSIVNTNGIYTDADYSATFDITTIIGALETIFKLLRNQYPNAIIIFVIPHINEHNTSFYVNMMNVIRDCCAKWSIAVLDMMKDGELNARTPVMRALFTDQNGTHPNTNGIAKFYVPKLIAKLAEYFTN